MTWWTWYAIVLAMYALVWAIGLTWAYNLEPVRDRNMEKRSHRGDR